MSSHQDRPRWNDIFVKRPVIAIVVSLLLLLAGLRSAIDIPVLQFPVIKSSSIQIMTPYPGATAESVQGFVTEPIERVANAIPGVDYVESTTTSGESIVTAWMKLNENSTDALAELSSGLSQIRLELPDGAEDPFIEVSRADSPYASFYLAVRVPETRPLGEVTDIVQRDIVPQLTSVPNVQRVENSGVRPAMRIWLNAWKMAALNVTAHEVRDTLQSNNVISALGASESATQRITLKTDATARTAEDFQSMIIRSENGAEIRLGDVARIELGIEEMQMRSRYDQDIVVFLPIYAAPGASEIAVADALYDRIEEINKILPDDLELFMAFDISNYMRDSLREIVITLGETILLVGFVVVALMGSFRTALVPLMTIPISLLGAVAAMSVIGFSFNLLTVLAIVLSVGLVVDDAIVVVENVARNLRSGMSRYDAALTSSRRLLGPITAMTATLAVVYAPIGFLSGLSGVLFREFAFALGVAVLISGFVALTLSPILSAWVCPDQGHESATTRWVNRRFDRTADIYARVVDFSLKWRYQLITASVFFSLLSAPLYLFSLKELSPVEDQSSLGLVFESAPEASLAETLQGFYQVVSTLDDKPEPSYMWQIVTPTGGFGGQEFVPPGDRDRPVKDMVFEIYQSIKDSAIVSAIPFEEASLPSAGRFDVEVVITSSDSSENMLKVARSIVDEAQSSGNFLFVETDIKIDRVEAQFEIDKERLADLGMSLGDLSAQMGLMVSPAYITRFDERGRAYRVIPMLEDEQRDSPSALLDIPIKIPNGELVPFGSLVTLTRTTEPRALTRFQQKDGFKIYGAILPGTTKDQGLSMIESIAERTLPDGYVLDYLGESRELRSEGNTMTGVLGIATVLVFLVLAIQFNSFRDPLIILLGSIPLALFAALTITFLNFSTINIFSQVGLITLVGLVTKNAILIVDFANHERMAGVEKLDAIRNGAIARLRPVLMTTGATVLGHFPLVLVTGAGAEARNSIGAVLVFGMLIGTLFTLVILPAIYAVLASNRDMTKDIATDSASAEDNQTALA
ncbi:efflux RND transporter permease subunit [Luminiphilus sp.]|nr:efflux RND transporter permease subunit [Luminiphilus sp.]MDB2312967.1 efflux RND transporter permease subunit [Luminiphilus sp.]MDB2379480.1 efflux RND transporter permease subunit [Luminiphilus sp.]MDB2659606.1 efflux RND transporter permease subunit [Luminiphilus sp.]MDB2666877.1 efflux RND transporter permease subunit [Luminiphilus sp.]